MAVELRCPGCRAKLRLPTAPEADSEIECPKCGQVFPADDNIVHAGSAEEEERPRKKPSNDRDDDKPKKEAKTADKAVKLKKKNKKRKLKKKKTSPIVLVIAVLGGLMVLGCVIGALIWFFNRKSASMEMMTYLPADCDEVTGVNLGHLQKYPEFYTTCESTFANTGFKRAGEILSHAIGQEMNETIDYVVQGTGRSGGTPGGSLVEATVFRTKAEFDTGRLSKLPGAQDYTQDGVKYYTIEDIPELGYPGLRVFAPTNRIVVFCRGDMPDSTFRGMLNGNKDNPDATVFNRSGQLGKQIIRGTAWKFTLYGRSIPKPEPPAAGEGRAATQSGSDQFKKEITDILSASQGSGYKASVGSRDVRGEWVVWYKDSEAASSMLKKWKDKDWIQDSEKDPPRWWKDLANKSGGGKTAPNVIRDGLAFKQSGETFIVRSSMDAKLVGIGTLVNAFGQSQQRTSGSGGGPSRPTPSGGPRRRRVLSTRSGNRKQRAVS